MLTFALAHPYLATLLALCVTSGFLFTLRFAVAMTNHTIRFVAAARSRRES